MGLDICWPIGLMFTLIGALLTGFGAVKSTESISLGLNINLIWGVALILFGAGMLVNAILGARRRKQAEADQSAEAVADQTASTGGHGV